MWKWPPSPKKRVSDFSFVACFSRANFKLHKSCGLTLLPPFPEMNQSLTNISPQCTSHPFLTDVPPSPPHGAPLCPLTHQWHTVHSSRLQHGSEEQVWHLWPNSSSHVLALQNTMINTRISRLPEIANGQVDFHWWWWTHHNHWTVSWHSHSERSRHAHGSNFQSQTCVDVKSPIWERREVFSYILDRPLFKYDKTFAWHPPKDITPSNCQSVTPSQMLPPLTFYPIPAVDGDGGSEIYLRLCGQISFTQKTISMVHKRNTDQDRVGGRAGELTYLSFSTHGNPSLSSPLHWFIEMSLTLRLSSQFAAVFWIWKGVFLARFRSGHNTDSCCSRQKLIPKKKKFLNILMPSYLWQLTEARRSKIVSQLPSFFAAVLFCHNGQKDSHWCGWRRGMLSRWDSFVTWRKLSLFYHQ